MKNSIETKITNDTMKIPSRYSILGRKEKVLYPRIRGPESSQQNAISSKTKDFIQKFCYLKSATVDMTKYGFINDRIKAPMNLMMRPLKTQLAKIIGKPADKIIIPRRRYSTTKSLLRKQKGEKIIIARKRPNRRGSTASPMFSKMRGGDQTSNDSESIGSGTSKRKTSSAVQAAPLYINKKRWGSNAKI